MIYDKQLNMYNSPHTLTSLPTTEASTASSWKHEDTKGHGIHLLEQTDGDGDGDGDEVSF